ncbi:MAG TPA: prephenate dehydratase domain-containing protein, partial [Solirubrobacteraceae bacterium]|nr:prephenate dehydratase domain-containing protein [Solirubrobacteraceae bacterium]
MSPLSEPAEGDAAAGLPRVGYLGPEGTFTEQALLGSAAAGAVAPVALATIYEAIEAVRAGAVDFSVVPIENSLDGSVTVTLDLLADDSRSTPLRIVGETLLSVRHSLIAARELALEEIDTVLTHPQVPGQCERFLRGELPRAAVLAASSTAEAVRRVVEEGRGDQAALGTVLAASIYGGTVLREGVQDRDDNETRFVWLAAGERAAVPEPPLREEGQGDEWKTSVVFWGPGADSAGWLVRCLAEFSERGINLTKIESRPN